jgi:hypothetical protein
MLGLAPVNTVMNIPLPQNGNFFTNWSITFKGLWSMELVRQSAAETDEVSIADSCEVKQHILLHVICLNMNRGNKYGILF